MKNREAVELIQIELGALMNQDQDTQFDGKAFKERLNESLNWYEGDTNELQDMLNTHRLHGTGGGKY